MRRWTGARGKADGARRPGRAWLVAVLLACGSSITEPVPVREVELPAVAVRDSLVAFVDVRVVPMDREVVHAGWTVLVRAGRIVAAGPASGVDVPAGARRIEGHGRYLMPGLVDAHVHINTADAPEYVRHGVTTVRHLWGYPALLGLQQAIAAGTQIGPTILAYSSGLDAPPVYWPFTQVVETPEAARAVVAEQLAQGWIGIKVYADLSRPVYDAIAEASAEHGVPFVGHVPHRVGLARALEAGQASLEHLLGYGQALTGVYGSQAWLQPVDDEAMRTFAAETVAAGAWNCPTLGILRRQSGAGHASRLRVVALLHEAGAPLLAGSDAGIDVTAPGRGLREELAHLVEAGLTPYEALRAATVDVARFLGQPGEFGVVAAGARADLLLLDRNPLDDVVNAGTLAGVMLRGVWLPAGPR